MTFDSGASFHFIIALERGIILDLDSFLILARGHGETVSGQDTHFSSWNPYARHPSLGSE
jgi:hypothetical protein